MLAKLLNTHMDKTLVGQMLKILPHLPQLAEAVGTGERNERIRTYNFPQNRVTDHRIELTLYNLPFVMEGDIDPVIEPLMANELEEKLATLTTAN